MRDLPYLILCLLFAGCKSAPETHVKVVPDQTPAGWTTAQSPDGSVRIGVPPGWRYGADRMFDMAGIDMSQFQGEGSQELRNMSAGMEQDAAKQEAEEMERLAAKGVLIQVISTGNKPIVGEARTRFYVLKKTQGSSLTLEGAAEVERSHFPFTPKFQVIQLPIGEAIRTSQTNELRDGGVKHEISYVVVNGKDMYSLRFVTQQSPDVINSIAEQVAQTLRIAP